jgi:ATP-binding cassette, subfamily C, bacterial
MRLFDPRTRRFMSHFMRAYPARSALMILLLAMAGLLEGIGVVSMLPLLEVAIGDGGSEGASRFSHTVARLLGMVGLSPTLGVLLAIIVTAMTGKAVLLWLAMRHVGYTVAQVTTDLRMNLVRSLVKTRWAYYASQRTGRIANAISNEAHRAASAYREACAVVAGLLQMAAYLGVALVISWQMALAAFVIGPLFFLLPRGFVRAAREAGIEQTRLMRSLVARLTDALRGIKAIRAMGREKHLQPLLERETEGLNGALRREVLALETLKLFQEPILIVLLAIGLFAALAVAGQPFPAVLVLAFVFYRLMANAKTVQTRYQVLTVGESAFWSLMEQVETARRESEELPGRRPVPPLAQGIRLEDVWFGYGGPPVLAGVSLTIGAGRFTVLYGPSGAGKTTIADLILGLYRPDGGRIYVDGIPLERLDLLAWRRGVGYVPQESFLFHDTIYRNVTLGDDSVSRDEVERALRAAGAEEFVRERAAGLDTVIGEAGTKLSGGQRQRLSIARALLHRPRLLILDECTANLDPETEREILRTLRDLGEEVTILVISHQPAVREAADVVYCLERGVVREVQDVTTPARIGEV